MKNLRFHRWIKDQVQLNFNLVLSISIFFFLQTQVAINLYVVVLCSSLLICWLCSSLLTCWLRVGARLRVCRSGSVQGFFGLPTSYHSLSVHVHVWVVQVNGPLTVPHGQPLQCVSSPGEWPFDCATWTTPPVCE